MATYFIGVNNGASGSTVTESATTTGKDVEIAINTTANVPAKSDVVVALQKLLDYVVTANKNW